MDFNTQYLSIPYWDFLVLNPNTVGKEVYVMEETFNSLLGFSSFESGVSRYGPGITAANFQFPIGIF